MDFVHFLAPFMMSKKCPKCNALFPAWCDTCIYCGAKTITSLPGLKEEKQENCKKDNSKKEMV
jgi:hypothetical protein